MIINFKINSAKVVFDSIDGEVIMINFENGNYYSLNASGREIWSLLEKNAGTEDIIKNLSITYESNPEVISEEVMKLLKELEQEELLIRTNEIPPENSQDIGLKYEAVKVPFQIPALNKYTDMKEMLMLDPIHEVDETGWPAIKKPKQNLSGE